MMKDRPAMKHSQVSGFTLVEIISVLVIVGILSAVALPDFFNLQERIRNKMVDNVIKDLNHREYLIWATYFEEGHDDIAIFTLVNPGNIGAKFTWSVGPNTSGTSTITFGPTVVDVKRTPSASGESGYWTRVTVGGGSDLPGGDSDEDATGGDKKGKGNQGKGNANPPDHAPAHGVKDP
jgi:prepilin-type N-terminal cleavage/methylation domain-containing protein